MKQHGVRIKRKKDGQEVFLDVFHLSLSYMDWAIYAGSTDLFDPATVRYLLTQYVVRAVDNGKELTIQELLAEDMSVIENVISNIVKKSIFQSPEEFDKLLAALESKSRTLFGCYDLFIYQHLGIDSYLRMLDVDAEARIQIVMMLEKITGINVRERFDEAVAKTIPLDLMSTPDQYKRSMKKYGAPRPQTGEKRRSPLDEFRDTSKERPSPSKEKMPSNIDAMLAESRSALADALNAGRKKPPPEKPVFNWHKDQVEQFETE